MMSTFPQWFLPCALRARVVISPRRFWLTILLICCGCGGRQDKWVSDRPPVFPASGVVFYNGQPLEKCLVTFQPETGPSAAFAITDAEGTFHLQTYQPGDGASAGHYRVAFSKTRLEYPEGVDPETYSNPPKIIEMLPDSCTRYDQSGLEASITEGGENAFTFRLDGPALSSK